MQGLESLNQFQKFVSTLGGLGRYGDTYMIHAEEGETVVPMEVLDRNPLLKKRLFKSMRALGIDPGRYIVGNNLNSLNPVTGQPEFFLKRLKKALGDISGYVAPAIGAMYGPGWGALAGAGLGAFKREQPGDPSQWQQMGMLGGASGIASNILGGGGADTNWLTGRGLSGRYNTMNPLTIGKSMLGMKGGVDPVDTGYYDKWFGTTPVEKSEISADIVAKKKELIHLESLPTKSSEDISRILRLESEIASSLADASKKTGMDMTELISIFGLGTLGLGALIGEPDEDVGTRIDPYVPHGKDYGWDLPATIDYDYPTALVAQGGIIGYNEGGLHAGEGFAPDVPGRTYGVKEMEMWRDFISKKQNEAFDERKMEHFRELMKDPEFKERLMEEMFGAQTMEARHGGIMDLQGGGFSQGPGTGTSDSIPAMLSDGEFVMTADAVRGAGGGNRREGARRMYEMMDGLEARA